MPRIKKEDIKAYVNEGKFLCKDCGCEEGYHFWASNIVTESILEKVKGDDYELYCDLCGELLE